MLAGNLTRGKTASCGHESRTADGLWKNNRHLYDVWAKMRRRCENPDDPSYAWYGAKGIRVCERWRSFRCFLSDVGERPQGAELDRVDNLGDYTPENTRWVTHTTNMNNTRANRVIECGGHRMTVAEWARHLGWSYTVLASRLSRGWSVERTLTQPPRQRSVY